MTEVTVGLIGAGAIGRFHAKTIRQSGLCRLVGIADPYPAGAALAEAEGVALFGDHRGLLAEAKPEAVIIATPNTTHVPIALDAIAAGVVPLVEKPIAETAEEGDRLAEASRASGVPVLVGHHRRHNPLVRAARAAVREGRLGRLTNVTVLSAFYKHDAYFDVSWRRSKGGGPILINLIHEIDLIRYVCGEIASVSALASNAVRGFAVEDTAAVLMRLTTGALVTVSLSDAASAPWSWDLASRELPAYQPQPQVVESHYLSGTDGSLTLPNLQLWTYEGERSWFRPMAVGSLPVELESPYVAQLRHLGRVVRREEKPVIDAADATLTLRATLAVSEAARAGRTIELAT